MKFKLQMDDVKVDIEYYGQTGYGGAISAYYLIEADYWDRVEYPSEDVLHQLARSHLKATVKVESREGRVLQLFMPGRISRARRLDFFFAIIDRTKYLGRST